MDVSFQYRAFISYSHTDEAQVSTLHRRLERYLIPRAVVRKHNLTSRKLRPIFRDRDELAASSSLTTELQRALENSEFLIVACSHATKSSKWVNEEIAHFLKNSSREKVLTVLVGDDQENIELPEILAFEVDASGKPDLNKPLEPLAADLREFADGVDGAVLKLAATMVGAQYDELVQREQHERNRRLARIATFSSVGMLAAISLAVYALLQRAEAIEQTEIAQRESRTANQVVEFLTDTFRVADPATENPSEITALTILERGAERLSTELEGESVVRARLMATIGDVYENLGLYQNAENMFQASLDVDQSDPKTISSRLVSLARTKWRKADLDEVEPLLAQADHFLSSDADPEVRAQSESLRGILALSRGQLDSAKAHMTDALSGFAQVLGEDHPTTARAKARLAVVYVEKQDFNQALPLLDHAIRVFSDNFGVAHSATASLVTNRANARIANGDFKGAQQDLDAVVPVMEAIYGESHPNVATAYFNLGDLYLKQRDPRALSYLTKARTVGEQFYGAEHGFLVRVLFNLAVAQAREQTLKDANATLDEVRRILLALYGATHPQIPFVTTQRGVVHGESGDAVQARRLCNQGIDELRALPTAPPEYIALAQAECADWL